MLGNQARLHHGRSQLEHEPCSLDGTGRHAAGKLGNPSELPSECLPTHASFVRPEPIRSVALYLIDGEAVGRLGQPSSFLGIRMYSHVFQILAKIAGNTRMYSHRLPVYSPPRVLAHSVGWLTVLARCSGSLSPLVRSAGSQCIGALRWLAVSARCVGLLRWLLRCVGTCTYSSWL